MAIDLPHRSCSLRPGNEEFALGASFTSWLSESSGMQSEILSGTTGSTIWSYRQSAIVSWRFPLYFFFKTELVITNSQANEILRIRRVGGFVAGFEMIQNGGVVGTIHYHSVLRTRCTIVCPGNCRWEMRQPLYTIYFSGRSETGERLWIMVGPSKRQWNLLLPASTTDVYLLSALALMHREYWMH